MDLVGINEFARRKGVSHTLVGRAIKNGRIKYHEDTKKIDWDTQSIAFDNNCNLKFKMSSRTRGDLAREVAAGNGIRPKHEIPMPTMPKRYEPKPPPPPPAPKKLDKPKVAKPKPVREKPTKQQPIIEPEPTADEQEVEIPPVSIPRKPKIPKSEKPELTEDEKQDLENEKARAQDRFTFDKARAAEQVLKAQKLQLEVRILQKEYMPVIEVKKGVYKLAEFVTKGMQSIPDRISDEIAGMNDPTEIHSLMTKEINNILQELRNGVAGIAP